MLELELRRFAGVVRRMLVMTTGEVPVVRGSALIVLRGLLRHCEPSRGYRGEGHCRTQGGMTIRP